MTGRPAIQRLVQDMPGRVVLFVLVAAALSGCRATPTRTAAAPAPAAPVAQVPAAFDPAARSDVAALTSPDFVERSRASERLVATGISALPALGAAGVQPVLAHGEARVSTTRPVIQAILQDASADGVAAELTSPFAVVRRGAAEELGRRGRWRPIPELIVRLDDPDPGVRAAAAASLRRLTNNFFGYSARAGSRARSEAAARWRSWWTQEGRRKQVERDTDTTASLR